MKRLPLALITTIVFLISSIPSSSAADTSAPQLVDWALETRSADISTSPRLVTVKFILTDDSRINEPKLLVKSLETTQLSSFAIVKEIVRAGKLVSYEATATINVGQAPREWEWVLYPVTDEFGNTNNTFGPGGVWPVKIRVFDQTYTSSNYNLISQCLAGLRVHNRVLARFFTLQKSDPNNLQLLVLKLKYAIPESVLDEKLCETDTARISAAYGVNQGAELADALTSVQDEVDLKNAKTAQAARDKATAELKAKQEAETKARAELRAKQEATAKATATKKVSITCVKGNIVKKVTAVVPKCPTGYKLKK